MAKRTGGFIGQDGINAPDPATGVSASGSNAEATVSFTAPTDVGGAAVTGYRVQSNDGIGASGSASPVTVTGLSNGTSYTFNVWAINPFGWSSPSDASGSVTPSNPRAVFFAGDNGPSGKVNTIDYIEILTTGNATDFGDLSFAADANSACSSSTRGVSGLFNQYGVGQANVMEYVTIATTSNATDFGDLTVARRQGASASS